MEAASNFLLEHQPQPEDSAETATDRALALASTARSFIDHPYWARMMRMLANSEKAEMEQLLDPTAGQDAQTIARASVVYIRRLQQMPFTDLRQGEEAAKVIEKFEGSRGVNSTNQGQSPGRVPWITPTRT